jgi:hypothetical protein
MSVHDPKVLRARLEELATKLPFEVTTRQMMGGFIGYADGRTFVSISTGGRVNRLVSLHCSPMGIPSSGVKEGRDVVVPRV